MNASVCIEKPKDSGFGTQLPQQFYIDCLAALEGANGDAAMVLDACGNVVFCNREGAMIFDRSPEELMGRHVGEFVSDTSLRAWTPGNNVAYAAYTGKRSQWRQYCVLDADGWSFPVELLLDVLVVNLRYLILLWIRAPAGKTVAKSHPGAYPSPGRSISNSGAFGAT